MTHTLIKIYHGRTYQRTNSHNNYSAHLRVVQYYKLKLNSTVESICEYILDEYVPIRTVPELIVGGGGGGRAAVEFLFLHTSGQ